MFLNRNDMTRADVVVFLVPLNSDDDAASRMAASDGRLLPLMLLLLICSWVFLRNVGVLASALFGRSGSASGRKPGGQQNNGMDGFVKGDRKVEVHDGGRARERGTWDWSHDDDYKYMKLYSL